VRFQKKPSTIEAEQFQPDKMPWPSDVHRRDDGTFFVCNDLHKSDITIKPGDWVRVDIPGDRYPIDAKYMEENFVPAPAETTGDSQ